MRIAFIVDAFPAFSETFILRQIQGLRKAGHEIMIFAGSPGDNLAPYQSGIAQELLLKVRLYNAKPGNSLLRILVAIVKAPVLICRSPRGLLNALNFEKYKAEAWSLNYYFQALAFSQASNADVIIAHFGPNGLVGARMKELEVLKGRLYCFFHAYDLTSYVAREGEGVYQSLFSHCSRALAISERGRKRLAALGCPLSKIGIIHMGVDLEEYSFAERSLEKVKQLRIISVARLVEKKGIAFAIEAVRKLIDLGYDVVYTVIGDGPLRGMLEEMVVRLGLAGKVFFRGVWGSARVRQEMLDAHILLLPSVTVGTSDEEGIPVVLMEALASGLPVVACESGAVGEIIVNGVTGILLPSRDQAAICEGVQRLLDNPRQVRGMSLAGRDLVERCFNTNLLDKEIAVMLQGGG